MTTLLDEDVTGTAALENLQSEILSSIVVTEHILEITII